MVPVHECFFLDFIKIFVKSLQHKTHRKNNGKFKCWGIYQKISIIQYLVKGLMLMQRPLFHQLYSSLTYCWVKLTTEQWPHSWSLPSWPHWLSPWLGSPSLVPPHSFHSLQTLKTFRIILILVHCLNFDWSMLNFDNDKLIFFHFHTILDLYRPRINT